MHINRLCAHSYTTVDHAYSADFMHIHSLSCFLAGLIHVPRLSFIVELCAYA